MIALKQILAILRKDILLELRSKDIIVSMSVFAFIVVIVFNFTFDPTTQQIKNSAPGILWVALLFSGNIGLSRAFAREQENSMMQGMLLCPVDRSLIYVAKVIGNVIFMTFVQLIILPVMVILLDLSIGKVLPQLLVVLFLGTLGFAGIGTLFSTISANTKSREVMLPILLFPVSVPVILSATKSTAYLISGQDIGQSLSWIKLLIGFDVIFLVICFLLYEYVIEE